MLKLTTTRQAREFLPDEPMMYFFPETEGGSGLPVRLRFVSHLLDKRRPVLCIEVTPETRKKDICDNWKAITTVRDELLNETGPWLRGGGGKDQFYHDVIELRERARRETGKRLSWQRTLEAVQMAIAEATERGHLEVAERMRQWAGGGLEEPSSDTLKRKVEKWQAEQKHP